MKIYTNNSLYVHTASKNGIPKFSGTAIFVQKFEKEKTAKLLHEKGFYIGQWLRAAENQYVIRSNCEWSYSVFYAHTIKIICLKIKKSWLPAIKRKESVPIGTRRYLKICKKLSILK